MRRFTGPGKVLDNTNSPPGFLRDVLGLLYNFDVDDASLKKEHQAWLDQNVVDLLHLSRDARVFLKGTTSRSGDDEYNFKLSERRTESVTKYLLGKGAAPSQVAMNWVGEEEARLAHERDGTENELDRAVGVSLRLPRFHGVIHFERVIPTDVNDGFDPGFQPQWLMVPALGGRRELVLVSGEGVRLFTDRPAVLQLVSPFTNRAVDSLITVLRRQRVQFQGNLPGEATIFAADLLTGAVVPVLSVSVLPRLTVSIRAWRVTDPDHPTPGRAVSSINNMVQEADKLYLRQANIHLELAGTQLLPFTQRLSDPTAPLSGGVRPITGRTVGGEDFPLLRNDPRVVGSTARVNVFFVWEWEPDTPDTDAEANNIPGTGVIFEDRAGAENPPDVALSFMHEVGHCLGLFHRETSRQLVMWPVTDQRGGRLERDEILVAQDNV
jgi:hypothetical protein